VIGILRGCLKGNRFCKDTDPGEGEKDCGVRTKGVALRTKD